MKQPYNPKAQGEPQKYSQILTVIPLVDVTAFVVHDARYASEICLRKGAKKYESYPTWDEMLEDLFNIHVRESIKTKRLQACRTCIGEYG